eukprot:CAMPEP_0203998972 /NCGR_PEP_ID=MMETSP0360-20130528/14333_1 /ASSEMBLY_ACC=CAM_ASM_000342 /TAXON_ID=268821 /ORGANISM="Scrippsiella Hangoei, Strain SHTV-5" /LENGTH=714 /DNA_ID=CAMNT_0050940067 /DNA_START=128 /DNA_END=2268 /DNA_ORIENTATION=+
MSSAAAAIALVSLGSVLASTRTGLWPTDSGSAAFVTPRVLPVRTSMPSEGPSAAAPSAPGAGSPAAEASSRISPSMACGAAGAAVAILMSVRRSRNSVPRVCRASSLGAFVAPTVSPALCGRQQKKKQEQQQQKSQTGDRVRMQAVPSPEMAEAVEQLGAALRELPREFFELLGPALPAEALDSKEAGSSALDAVKNFFFDPRLQWDENGNILLDPKGDPLPDNLWTQFVAVQATLMKRLDQSLASIGVPQSFGWAVAVYTLLIRSALYPLVKGQLETTAKIQVLAPRVNELKEKYKDNEERMQQEVGLLYMDLQVDPLGAVFPLLFQLPVFWGLYRAIRRLAIVQYEPLMKSWLWIPSLYGPNYTPDPSFKWVTEWVGPLIELHPKIGWTDFALFSILPVSIALAYREVLKEATADANSPKLLQALPFLLAFITVELPQAMGIYIATNIITSVTLTQWTKDQISSKIPGYDEFVKTGSWPAGVDPEKVLAKAFGVKRLVGENMGDEDPVSVPEAVFAGRADYIPELLKKGKGIDDFDDRGIPASAYTLALNNSDLLQRLLELGASPTILDKKGNSLLHYAAGYGRHEMLPMLFERDTAKLINQTNEDGQTPIDVARMNLSQENVSEDVKKVIEIMNEKGAEGKKTTQADESRFIEERDKLKKKKELETARSALKAIAIAAVKREAAAQDQVADAKVAEEAAAAKAEEAPAASG